VIAAGRAVATIVATRHSAAPASGLVAFCLTVSWYAGPAGERWLIALTDATVALDRDAALEEAERLLQPTLQLMQPRAVRYLFRSRMDEATLEDLNNIQCRGASFGRGL
jgi:hypothetical protein